MADAVGKREERIQNTSGSAVGTAAALASHPGLAAQIGGAGPLVLGALALLVVAGPYWGGLLLPAQYMPVAVLLLLAVGWGVRSGSGFPAGAYPILVGGGVVVLGYFASVAGAAHPNAAFLEVYRALLPYLALMAGLRCHLNEARLLCWGVAAAAVGSLVLGLLGPVGGPAPEAMWADGRLQGVFQYANATADYLAVGAITGLWLGAKSGARAWQLAGGVAGCLCLTGVFLTGSRAVLPFLALALVSLVLFAPSEFFRRRASLTGTALLGAVLGANISLTYYVAGRPWAALAGCLVPLLLVPVALIRPCRSSRPGTDDAVRPAQRALATAGIAAGLAVQGLVAGLFGRRFVLAASEFQERLVYYSDALRIVRDHALLGVGGDGWRSVQYGYQSACYSVGLVHSYPLQVVLDAGVVAAVGFILVLAAFGRAVLRGLRESFPERRDVLCLGVSCVTLLFGHNLLDLSLAYPPLAGLGWFFLASPWWGTGPGRPLGQGRVGTACRRASLLVWLVLLAGAGYGTAGEWQARAVQARAWAGDLHGAWAGYADLVRWYRAPAHVHHEMGRVWEAELRRTLEGSQCEEAWARAWQAYRTAHHLDPGQPAHAEALARLLFYRSRYAEAAGLWDKALKLNPLGEKHYEGLATALLLAGEECLVQGREAEALVHWRRAAELPRELAAARARADPRAARLKHPLPQGTPAFWLAVARAQHYLGNEAEAVGAFRVAVGGHR